MDLDTTSSVPVVVAGHCCLDIIPKLSVEERDRANLLHPGNLIEVGPAALAPGGAVSNTGLTLRRLGIPASLIGKVGDDLFGTALLKNLTDYAPELTGGMICDSENSTSYTAIISSPGLDRIFFHYPGANNGFCPSEIDLDPVRSASILHFGYPPLMRKTYQDGGLALAKLFERAQDLNVSVSLDMAQPDPDSSSGQVDWKNWLSVVLPYVDLFVPSLDEVLYMFNRDHHNRLKNRSDRPINEQIELAHLTQISNWIHSLGTPIVAIKLGSNGLYLHTSNAVARHKPLRACSGFDPKKWANRQLLRACFQVEEQGTTGAGDATVAGLVASIILGLNPVDAVEHAVGVGGFSVEGTDATGAIPTWKSVSERIRHGWNSHVPDMNVSTWDELQPSALWGGPADEPSTH